MVRKEGKQQGRGQPAKEPFGQVAVRKGFVTPQQVEEALTRQRALRENDIPHKPIGLILLEMGALGTTELIEVLREMNVPCEATVRRDP